MTRSLAPPLKVGSRGFDCSSGSAAIAAAALRGMRVRGEKSFGLEPGGKKPISSFPSSRGLIGPRRSRDPAKPGARREDLARTACSVPPAAGLLALRRDALVPRSTGMCRSGVPGSGLRSHRQFAGGELVNLWLGSILPTKSTKKLASNLEVRGQFFCGFGRGERI